MNKNQRSHRKRKPNGLLTNVFKFIILLSLTFGINSCKKDILVSPKLEHQSQVDVKTISYSEFLNSVNVNTLGLLKSSFQKSNTKKLASIDTTSSFGNLAIYTDSLKKFVTEEGTSFVFKMQLNSPRARVFRNLTIYVHKGGKTSAFIATYTPSNQWINARRVNKLVPFEGETSFAPIDLKASNIVQGLSNVNKKQSINGNGIKQIQTICYPYTTYTYTPYGCNDGNHMPWDTECIWNTGTPVPENGRAAYWAWSASTQIICEDFEVPDPPSGGGGGTTPDPPGDYDPCDDPPAQTSIKKSGGFSLQALPPNPCDGQNPPPPPPPSKASLLINYYELTGADKNYILANQAFGTGLYEILEYYDFDSETYASVGMTISAVANDVTSTSNSISHYNAVRAYLPDQNIDPNVLLRYLTIQCAIVKAQNPSYNEWQVYWAASKEMVHLMLDGVGLVPGIGEIADITNGAIYTIQGDGVNATLSYASALPIAGWVAAGAKVARKGILTMTLKSDGLIYFGSRTNLRYKVLGLAVGDPKQAHHIIPWAKFDNIIVQRAAKAKEAFHMNQFENGIALSTAVHSGSHAHYDNLIELKFVNYLSANPNATPSQCYNFVMDLLGDIRTAIQNNPNVPINQLNF